MNRASRVAACISGALIAIITGGALATATIARDRDDRLVSIADASGGSSQSEGPAPVAADYTVVDDFSGPAGSAPDPSKWTSQVGAGGWGNDELQTYTAASAHLDGSGHLIIEARRHVDSAGRTTWTSARLSSFGKQSFGLGTLSARIKLPDGQGLLPAFWTMGDSLDRVGWPAAVEIDIVETPNSTAVSSHNMHGPITGSPPEKSSAENSSPEKSSPQKWSAEKWSAEKSQSWETPLRSAFHTFSVERSSGRVVIRVDDLVVSDLTRASISPDMEWVFDAPQHALLSLAVGGNWPGDPTAATPEVSKLVVDWVHFAPADPFAPSESRPADTSTP